MSPRRRASLALDGRGHEGEQARASASSATEGQRDPTRVGAEARSRCESSRRGRTFGGSLRLRVFEGRARQGVSPSHAMGCAPVPSQSAWPVGHGLASDSRGTECGSKSSGRLRSSWRLPTPALPRNRQGQCHRGSEAGGGGRRRGRGQGIGLSGRFGDWVGVGVWGAGSHGLGWRAGSVGPSRRGRSREGWTEWLGERLRPRSRGEVAEVRECWPEWLGSEGPARNVLGSERAGAGVGKGWPGCGVMAGLECMGSEGPGRSASGLRAGLMPGGGAMLGAPSAAVGWRVPACGSGGARGGRS